MAVKKTTSKSKTAVKTPTKKTAAKTTPVKKTTVKKTVAKKAPTTKTAAKKTAASKKAPVKKATTQKTVAKKATHLKKIQAESAPSKTKSSANVSKTITKMPLQSTFLGSLGVEPYALAKAEEYMTDAQRKHVESILVGWKTQLMQEVDRTVNHMKDEAANFPDPNDRASQEEEFSLELRTRDRERKLINKIDKTLNLVYSEDFGYCEECGVEIGIRRLEARPTAVLCIDCKTLDEIKERQLIG